MPNLTDRPELTIGDAKAAPRFNPLADDEPTAREIACVRRFGVCGLVLNAVWRGMMRWVRVRP